MYRRILNLTLVGYAAMVLYAGWMPLNFRYERTGVAAELHRAVHAWPAGWSDLLGKGDVRLNPVLFLVPGGLLAFAKARRWRRGTILLAAAVGSACLSLAIEAGQLLLPLRWAHLHDVVTNVAGGVAGAMLGLMVEPIASALAPRLARTLKGRYGYLAAGVLGSALVACSAWRLAVAGARPRWADIVWSLGEGLGAYPWHKWLIRCVAAYAAFTLLLAAGKSTRPITPRRALLAATAATLLAAAIELLHLLVPGHPPNTAVVLMAALGAFGAALVAPRLHDRGVELPMAVLVCAVALTGLVTHIAWLSTGGGTSLPLWGLYRHEFPWAYYATACRWAVMAGLGLLLAFYLSLTRSWRLRYRMLVGSAIATGCAAALEAAKMLFGPGRINLAGLGEHTAAAVGGVLIFAMLWHILDRRDPQHLSARPVGPERRHGRPD